MFRTNRQQISGAPAAAPGGVTRAPAAGAQVYALERLAAGDLDGAAPLLAALAAALERLHKARCSPGCNRCFMVRLIRRDVG